MEVIVSVANFVKTCINLIIDIFNTIVDFISGLSSFFTGFLGFLPSDIQIPLLSVIVLAIAVFLYKFIR